MVFGLPSAKMLLYGFAGLFAVSWLFPDQTKRAIENLSGAFAAPGIGVGQGLVAAGTPIIQFFKDFFGAFGDFFGMLQDVTVGGGGISGGGTTCYIRPPEGCPDDYYVVPGFGNTLCCKQDETPDLPPTPPPESIARCPADDPLYKTAVEWCAKNGRGWDEDLCTCEQGSTASTTALNQFLTMPYTPKGDILTTGTTPYMPIFGNGGGGTGGDRNPNFGTATAETP